MKVFLTISVICGWLFSTPLHAADQQSTILLKQALEAQGGEGKLRALRNVQWEASGYRNELEESERPEGPYLTDFLSMTEVDDFEGSRYRNSTETTVYPLYKVTSTTVVNHDIAMRSTGGPFTAGSPQQVQLVNERLALSPERVLLTALDAPDSHREIDTVLQSVLQNVIAFTLAGAPVRLYLNAYTHLPTAVDDSGLASSSGYWGFLGDVTLRTYYSLWWLAKNGIHLPLQWTVEGNGMPDQTLVIRKLQIDEPLREADLTIPPEIRAQFDPHAKPRNRETIPLGSPTVPASVLAPGVVFIPGSWNVTLVRQNDGVVVLEAPISSGYSAQVIAEAHRRFPGQPIKAVITTSDSWPHIAGIRQYVAEGVPLYALDLNRPILERFIAAPRTRQPDTLAHSPRQPKFNLVHNRTILGTGANRLEIIPIRGETSERQMMVYFPEHRLLYGSDPFQIQPDGSYFYPQTVAELVGAVDREHLEVEKLFMMHVGPTPWSELPKVVAAAAQKNTPNGLL